MATALEVVPVDLECAICFELLHDSRCLQCRHSFCKVCLASLIRSQSKRDIVACPICRQITKIPSGDISKLQSNAQIQTGVANFKDKMASLEFRSESKIVSLVKDLSLLDEADDVIRINHDRLIAGIEEAFEECVVQLSKRRYELVEQCNRQRDANLSKLNEIREDKAFLICGISNAYEEIGHGTRGLLESKALVMHNRACSQLQDMLERDTGNDSNTNVITRSAENTKFTRYRNRKELELGKISYARPASTTAGPSAVMNEFLLSSDSIMGLARMPNGGLAVGYKTGGIQIFSIDGPLEILLPDVKIWALSVTSGGQYVIRDEINNISVYSKEFHKIDTRFATMTLDKGGHGDLDLDSKDSIYVGYWLAEKIHVFTLDGGNPTHVVSCRGYVPVQIRTMRKRNALVIKDGCTVRVVDDRGVVEQEVTRVGQSACPAVLEDDRILIAWVNDKEGEVTIDIYSKDLVLHMSVIKDFKIDAGWQGRCLLNTLIDGHLAFCKASKLYICEIPISALLCTLRNSAANSACPCHNV